MDKLSGFNLDNIPEQSSSTLDKDAVTLNSPSEGSALGTSPISRNDFIEAMGGSPSSLSHRRQSHTGSTRPSVTRSGNRAVSGGIDNRGGRNSLIQGLTSPPIRPETSGRSGIHSLLNVAASKAAAVHKQKPVGFKDKLKREQPGIVKRRTGAVLARGSVKSLRRSSLHETDVRYMQFYSLVQIHTKDRSLPHWYFEAVEMIQMDADLVFRTGRALDLDFHLADAPNWRSPREESLNVYGVAQPTLSGVKSILSLLGCRPEERPDMSRRESSYNGAMDRRGSIETDRPVKPSSAVWLCLREEPIILINSKPFVLRDWSAPKTTLSLSDRAENLEQVELKLKEDILRESRRYGGLILTHDELENGDLIPTWTSVDSGSVYTLKESFNRLQDEGWTVMYYRTPISTDRPIEDNYLDAYVSVLQNVDPLNTCLVFNDGLGAVRATYAMIAALIVRRKQYMLRDLDEPFSRQGSGISTPVPGLQTNQFFKQAAQNQAQSAALLKLTRLTTRTLETAADPKTAALATDLLVSQPTLLESLRNAYLGNYQVILSLLSSIDQGRERKNLVDTLIENCDQVINLKEVILESRLQYSISGVDEKTRVVWLDRAVQALERYFFLIAFASYIEEEDAGASGRKFSDWLLDRPEIWNHIKALRRRGGSRLFMFSPINDLSLISRVINPHQNTQDSKGKDIKAKGEVDQYENRVLGDEWSQYTIANRSGIILRAGTLLKSDQWQTDAADSREQIQGAVGFRHIPASAIFALGSSHADSVRPILDRVRSVLTDVKKILWINLREEPIVMINSDPYCLRKETMSLRNLKDYSGVSPSRLEIFDERLASDVIAELRTFDGKLLLHEESDDGYVRPVWEDVRPAEVQTLRQVMEAAKSNITDVDLQYVRLPITSRSVIEFDDIQSLILICLRGDLEKDTAIILNDQLGRGRSTVISVIMSLIIRWIKRTRSQGSSLPTRTPRLRPKPNSRSSWQLVNSCLRCLRHSGLEVKTEVDDVIDQCGESYNIREVIESLYKKADAADNENAKKSYIKQCKTSLKIYLELLQFQGYLAEVDADAATEKTSFQQWTASQPVFATFEEEIQHGTLEILMPIPTLDTLDGPASLDEAEKFVLSRHGGILSSGTIIKSDLFLGLQKQSLPERIEGASNFREVPLLIPGCREAPAKRRLYGSGMPTAAGLRKALARMEAQPGGSRHVVWTSLREEPVLYVAGIPYVLRLADKPITNIEAQGVENTVVEAQERQFKRDVLNEIAETGRILVHDEVETTPGSFEIVPIYETVEEKDVMTPRELYEQVQGEGYNVDYQRFCVTDERSPIPAVFATLIDSTQTHLAERDTDFVFNCQMGRGRTTTGMIVSSIIASIDRSDDPLQMALEQEDSSEAQLNSSVNLDDISEETIYKRGEYKMVLQLVSVLLHGREAKLIADRAADVISGVQNLREAVYDYKLKVDSMPEGPKRSATLRLGLNYLYRYAMLIVLADYLLECKESEQPSFSEWFDHKRELARILSRQTLD